MQAAGQRCIKGPATNKIMIKETAYMQFVTTIMFGGIKIIKEAYNKQLVLIQAIVREG